MNKNKITWSSSNFRDIDLGAEILSSIKLNNYDCFLVCSDTVNDDYRYILNNLNNKRKIPDIFWANGKFEFCGGTIPVSKNCENAEIVIFNHFPVYFGIYDKLLVKVKIFNSKDVTSFNLILKPFETKCIKLSDFIQSIKEPTCISHECFHPRLTEEDIIDGDQQGYIIGKNQDQWYIVITILFKLIDQMNLKLALI